MALLLGARASGLAAVSLLLSWGFEIAFAPLGAAALAALALAAVVVAWVALVKVLGMSRARAGLVLDQRFLQELPTAAIVAFLWMGLAMLTLWATGLGGLGTRTPMPHPALLVSGFIASLGLATFLQLTQSSVLVVLEGERPIRGATLAAPTALGVLSMLPFTTAPVALLNAALLSLTTSLLFSREDRREHAIPIGFHAGWLFVLVLVTGSAAWGVRHDIGLLIWPEAASVWTGGAAGFESGLVCTFVLAVLTGAMIRARFQPPDGAGGDAPPRDGPQV